MVASAFRDERIYNLLDLRTMVIMALQLCSAEFRGDLVLQDKLYQVMETIITKLQSIAELEEPQRDQVTHSFAEFIESCI